MKAEILKMLRESKEYVSGQQLCERLQVSRTAVWKVIKQLENEGYQIIWKKGSGSNDTQQIVPEILESLQFPDNELLTETFQTACQEQKRALEAENNSDGVKKQKGKKTVTCISPVNVRTEPNVSTSQVIGALTTGEEVEMLGKENGWYKISYEGKTAYVYEDYVKEKEN